MSDLPARAPKCLRLFPALLVLAVAPSALAQTSGSSASLFGGGFAWEIYRFAEPERIGLESLELRVAPLSASVPVIGSMRLSLQTSHASGRMVRSDGSRQSISGFTDSNLALSVPVAADAAITLTAALPTGRATQSLAEAEVAGVFAADLLPFRVSNWGSGGAYGVATSIVRSLGGFGVGASAGYTIAREYPPLREDERAYQPGDELELRLVVDRSIGRSGKASLRMSMNHFGEDVLAGQNLYRSGDRYAAVGSYVFPLGYRGSSVVYLGGLHRTRGTYLDVLQHGPSQNLIIGGVGGRLPMLGGVLVPQVDGRVFRSSDGIGQGYVATAGTGVEWPAGPLTVVPSLRVRFGRIVVRQGSESGLVGMDLGLVVRHAGSR